MVGKMVVDRESFGISIWLYNHLCPTILGVKHVCTVFNIPKYTIMILGSIVDI
jgi:hypothetical protein